jgi:hypothetical protein
MNTFAKGFLSLALGLGLSTSAFAQSAPPVPNKAEAKPEVSKTADKKAEAKAPVKKAVEHKVAETPAVKPSDDKKAAANTVHSAPKESPKPEAAAKPVK